jgi:RHH-type rel operon transcriptional repressor/antitoxin RelB
MAETRELTFLIDSETDDELSALARLTGRDKQSLAREALIEWIDDQEDILNAKAVIAEGNPSLSLEEVKRDLGLAS